MSTSYEREHQRSTGSDGIGAMSPADSKGRADLLDDGSESTGASTSAGTVRTEGSLARNIIGLAIVLVVIAVVVALLLRG